ncbi:hypothetical protein FPQ18DRAFT_97124 [Pyronema domesticum]|nr:hypothetical protein FPQ18DRAFT_97124 [Pyronema domesticum]
MSSIDRLNIPHDLLAKNGLDGSDDKIGLAEAIAKLHSFSLVNLLPPDVKINRDRSYNIHRLIHLAMQCYFEYADGENYIDIELAIEPKDEQISDDSEDYAVSDEESSIPDSRIIAEDCRRYLSTFIKTDKQYFPEMYNYSKDLRDDSEEAAIMANKLVEAGCKDKKLAASLSIMSLFNLKIFIEQLFSNTSGAPAHQELVKSITNFHSIARPDRTSVDEKLLPVYYEGPQM